MCGIAAILPKSNTAKFDIMPLLNAIKHRGDTLPNYKTLKNALLGNVRLKIVDRPFGEQPIYNEEETIAVVFNGEIYNYKKLKSELLQKGHIFKTDCDTEVLVHLYEQHGAEMTSFLDGMFAFIIYDSVKQTFFAARDNFGIKPLYYCEDETAFYFSSELKSFLHLGVTEFREIPPASYLTAKGITQYRNFETYPIRTNSLQEETTLVKSLVEEAVKKRVQTDLPIGVFLSGGIDSSIVFLLALKYHSDVTAIIIGEDTAEDVVHAKKLCIENNYKFKHINISKSEILRSIPDIIYSIESYEPNPVRGSAISYPLSKAAKELGIKIVLCGEGSDEIFGGYGDFIAASNEEAFQAITKNLLEDLYRTQLLRIDRTGMAFNVEVREPFMDIELVDTAIKIAPNFKVAKLNGRTTTKLILREAFKDILPEYIYSRDKMTLMEGAGADSVEVGTGMFYENAQQKISEIELEEIKQSCVSCKITNREEAYYFSIYSKFYSKAKFNNQRTFNAKVEIKKNS